MNPNPFPPPPPHAPTPPLAWPRVRFSCLSAICFLLESGLQDWTIDGELLFFVLIFLPFIEWKKKKNVFVFFFYRSSYFVRKRMTLSEIVMQEPFILHRSCDYCNERSVARGQRINNSSKSNSQNHPPPPPTPKRNPPPQDAGWYNRLVLYVNPII